MAELLDAASSPGYLKHALEAGRVTVICWLVLYLFDFLLTFGAERRHIWRAKWTPLKTFYFLTRYVTLAAIISNAALVLGRYSTAFVVPAAVAEQVKFFGCIPVQTRKRTFLTIWILPLCFDAIILLLTLVRQCSLRRNNSGSGQHALARTINQHLLYFSIIFACNALNAGFFILADPSLKSINVPATVALTSILTGRLVISLYSTQSTSPVMHPARRPSTSSSRSRKGGGGTSDSSRSIPPSRSGTSAGHVTPSSSENGSEGEKERPEKISTPAPAHLAGRPDENDDRRPSSKNPSISSRASVKTSSSAGSSSRRRRSQDHVIVPIVPDPSRYNYYSHRHSNSSSSSAMGGVLRPLLLANSLVPVPDADADASGSSSNTSAIVTVPPVPHPNPSMAPDRPPFASPVPTGASSHSIRSHSTTFSATTGLVHLDSVATTLVRTTSTIAAAAATQTKTGPTGPLEIPAIEPSTPLTFSAAFFHAHAVPSPNLSHRSRFRESPGDDEPVVEEEEDEEEEEDDDDEVDTTGDLGELTRETRDKLRRQMQRLERQHGRRHHHDDEHGTSPALVPIASEFSSSDEGRSGVFGCARDSSSRSSTSSKRSSAGSLGRSSLRYYTSQFPNPSESDPPSASESTASRGPSDSDRGGGEERQSHHTVVQVG
ncbi:hypothetical protein JCM11491_006937 [Sporobolomyces phaffii]